MPGLTIYKASAGSGKTHALVSEYLGIIFSNPGKFRHVLAVTFTNKATAEMKKRILEELSVLARGEKSDFRHELLDKYKLTDSELKEKAGEILRRILQNYSGFYIETIDKFFQGVIRSFAREIRLQPAYTIEMDEARVLDEAVDRMLSDADKDTFLRKWLSEFAEQKVLEGRNWNMKTDILDFSKEIFKEKFRESSDELIRQLDDRENINRYVNELNRYRYSLENRLKNLGDKAIKIIRDRGLEIIDFYYKEKGPAGFLDKLSRRIIEKPGKYVTGILSNPAGWYSQKSDRKAEIINACNSGLNEILAEVTGIMDRELILYNSIRYTERFLYILGILTDIIKKISGYLDEKNVFLISNSAYFLKEIIGNNETPFIYEKTGNYFTHFMIDEFQDTSRMQWNNFKPLISNSLALNHQNLVVGDIKQSIYRFRNSDWEILAEGINNDFREGSMVFRSLRENYRSRPEIINFNNEFFRSCRDILGEKFAADGDQGEPGLDFHRKLMNAYADIMQEIPVNRQKEGGYVEVSFQVSGDEKPWEDKSDEKVIEIIMMLQDNGYEPRDIAILVRKKDEGKRIADVLLRQKKIGGDESAYRYDMISDELLYLEGSSPVRLILGVMKYLVDPGEKINRAELISEYRRYLLEESGGIDLHKIFFTAGCGSAEDLALFMPDGFTGLSSELPYLSLNEITERIIALFGINNRTQDLPYLYAFQDVVLDYSRAEPPDLNSFLNWWDEFGAAEALITSEQQNAIRVMTIHKAKGLQFPAVIIPYCNWPMDHQKQEILWCTPRVPPLNQLKMIPVRYSSKLEDTVFREEYLKEKFRVHVDNLNLLYVALTRARDQLFIIAPFETEKYAKLSRASDLLGMALIQGQPDNKLSANFNRESLLWKAGDAGRQDHSEKIQPATEFFRETVSSTGSKTCLRTRWHGTDFLESVRERGINSGKFIHEILQMLKTADDLDMAIDRILREGKINTSERAEIRREIVEFLNLENMKDWFSGGWEVLMERDIITTGGQLKRPDRVMIKGSQVAVIDYKTGLSKRKEHEKQMMEYVDLIRGMGYQDVCGWLCYVRLNEIIQIHC